MKCLAGCCDGYFQAELLEMNLIWSRGMNLEYYAASGPGHPVLMGTNSASDNMGLLCRCRDVFPPLELHPC